MATAYIGEIRMFAGNFAPAGWALCNGQLLPISQYEALFNLIGTTYGGDGQSTFALPDLRSRIPMHQGNAHVIGETGGAEQVTLTTNQIPAHSHAPQANSGIGTQNSPGGNVWANSINLPYSANAPSAAMDPAAVGASGGSQPHDNQVPFLALNFIISLFGIFPSQ